MTEHSTRNTYVINDRVCLAKYPNRQQNGTRPSSLFETTHHAHTAGGCTIQVGKLEFTGSPLKRIDFGCGTSKKAGFIGVDSLLLPNVDVIQDLNVYPYPFRDSDIDEVWMDNVLEHLDKPLRAMEEVWRISKHGAKVKVAVPYFRSFYATIDPTHEHFFGVQWFNYFDPRHPLCAKYRYTTARFEIESIIFDREWDNAPKTLLHRIVRALAQKRPFAYEARLSHLYPLNSLTFYLKVIK